MTASCETDAKESIFPLLLFLVRVWLRIACVSVAVMMSRFFLRHFFATRLTHCDSVGLSLLYHNWVFLSFLLLELQLRSLHVCRKGSWSSEQKRSLVYGKLRAKFRLRDSEITSDPGFHFWSALDQKEHDWGPISPCKVSMRLSFGSIFRLEFSDKWCWTLLLWRKNNWNELYHLIFLPNARTICVVLVMQTKGKINSGRSSKGEKKVLQRGCSPFVRNIRLFQWKIKWNRLFHWKFSRNKINIFKGNLLSFFARIVWKLLYHLLRPTSTTLFDEMRIFLRENNIALQIVNT